MNTIKRYIPKWLKVLYCRLAMMVSRFKYFFYGSSMPEAKEIPIIINNFNRLTSLKLLIESLITRGYCNIHIIDNASTYPPLLEYYKICPYEIYRLDRNIGYKAIWESGIYDKFKHSYYVYTDADMQIDNCCPIDFMERFLQIMDKHPFCQKVGFGIRIDDLPDYFSKKQQVIEHESKYWINEIERGVFRAAIDTTFALYRPFCKGATSPYQETYRTGEPYIIRHLPWYTDTSSLSEEEMYYVNSVTRSTHWSAQIKKDS